MSRRKDFKAQAAACERKAARIKYPEAKRQLLAAADQWRGLADHATDWNERPERMVEGRHRLHRAALERRLAEAEKHILAGERHLTRQREIVAELERDGHDIGEAQKLLASFEGLQEMHVADRDRLRKKLALPD